MVELEIISHSISTTEDDVSFEVTMERLRDHLKLEEPIIEDYEWRKLALSTMVFRSRKWSR